MSEAAVARFVRDAVAEPEAIARARRHGLELGVEPVSEPIGAQLAVLAAAVNARAIVEIGTGTGVSGLWMLRGAPQAVLTTIDKEPEHLAAARAAFAEAKVPTPRVRYITGRAADVLPRMNEASYDIVLVDADADNVVEYVEHGLRLVRPGGLVLVPRVLAGGRIADPVQRDAATTAYRLIVQETGQSPAVLASLHPFGEGLLQLVSVAD